MIEICMAVYKTHYLLPLQVEYWKRAGEDVTFWVADDSGKPAPPLPSCVNIVPVEPSNDYDGVTYGRGLDTVVKLTSPNSKYIIINDSDFFWLHPNIWKLFLSLNVDCFGIGDNCTLNLGIWDEGEGDLEEIHNTSAPFLSGMIILRELALKHSFQLKLEEAQRHRYEVGWRYRHELICGNYEYRNLLGFRYSNQPQVFELEDYNPASNNNPPIFYGTPQKPYGVHILQATRRQPSLKLITEMVNKYRAFHDNGLHSHS